MRRIVCGTRREFVIWIVDKKVIRYLVQEDGLLAEVPIRVSFEYAVEEGSVVDGSVSLSTLYNKHSVCKHFPDIDDEQLDEDVQSTAERAVDEHLALCGFSRQ